MTRPTTDRRIVPFPYHEAPAAAPAWLTRAFGARQRFRLTGPQGGVAYAEIAIGETGVNGCGRAANVAASRYCRVP